MDLNKKIALAQKMKSKGINIGNERDAERVSQGRMQPAGPSFIKEGMQASNGYIYGNPGDGMVNQEQEKWNAEKELNEMNNGTFYKQNRGKKFTNPVLNEVANEPLQMPVPQDLMMDQITERLAENPAIKKAAALMSQTDGKKVEQYVDEDGIQRTRVLNEQKRKTQQGGSGNLDYDTIRFIVEGAIAKKIDELKQAVLNESASRGGMTASIKVMQMKEGKPFLLLDSDDNVYECVMKFKGKNRRRKKQQ